MYDWVVNLGYLSFNDIDTMSQQLLLLPAVTDSKHPVQSHEVQVVRLNELNSIE
jgi:hypothetical protein